MIQILHFNKSNEDKYRLIMLHGWGSNAEGLRYFSKIFLENININFEVISLNAPYPLSYPHCLDNPNSREWYKLYPDDWDQAKLEVEKLIPIIKKICSDDLPLEKTFLMGFSQGAAMAIEIGCNLNVKGVIGFGGYGHPHWIPPKKHPFLYLSHGLNDDCVKIKEIRDLINLFDNKNKIFLSTFEGGHDILDSEIKKIVTILKKDLNYTNISLTKKFLYFFKNIKILGIKN